MTQEIAPPAIRRERKATVEDILPLILEEGCGFRPSRTGGIRLESEIMVEKEGKEVIVVHNYGWVTPPTDRRKIMNVSFCRHSGYGYLSCFGSASMALELLEKQFN